MFTLATDIIELEPVEKKAYEDMLNSFEYFIQKQKENEHILKSYLKEIGLENIERIWINGQVYKKGKDYGIL